MRKLELLSPAGDMERLEMAVAYGADAVYFAGTSFGMRSFAGNFSPEELPKAVRYAHDHGVRCHVTVNTMPRNDEIVRLPEYLEQLDDAGVDALIVADLGAFTLAGKYAPHCERHISTQQSIANYVCAQAWFDLGAKRVVLARECSLEEIRAIRQKVDPALEIETFGHGAMCVSYSGRCLLSNYMTGRDSNRGACAQPCRYQYALMEEKRPGEYFPVFEDEKGTYILNSRDMCMIDHLNDLMDAGVDCIKIEGRAKSAYYAAIVTGAYRHCIDDVAAGKELDPVWRDEVDHISHRIYSTGFYYGAAGAVRSLLPVHPGVADCGKGGILRRKRTGGVPPEQQIPRGRRAGSRRPRRAPLPHHRPDHGRSGRQPGRRTANPPDEIHHPAAKGRPAHEYAQKKR